MVNMSTKQEIILRYYRHGDSQRKISRDLGISRKTVKRYLEEYKLTKKGEADVEESGVKNGILDPPRYDTSNRKRRKLTVEIKEEIDKHLEKNEEKRQGGQRKQILRSIDIWEELKRQGHSIGYTTVCNYIRGQASRKEAYIRQRYEAGQVCEFDWGEVKLRIDGILRAYQLAVFTLAYSNYRYAIIYSRQDSPSFQQSHVLFFHHLGGVAQQMVYDNMRVAVKRFVGRTEKEATDGLLGMSMYYQFGFRFCNVRKGNEKGHVERSVEYIRRKAFGLVDSFTDEFSANAHLKKILGTLNATVQKTKGQSAVAMLEEERKFFGVCPAVEMECASWKNCRVDKYSTISIHTNHYSVPEEFVGKMVEVKVYPDRLNIYYNGQALWSHQRRSTKFRWYLCLGHYLETLLRKPGALKGAEALEQANWELKSIYIKYFKDDPRQFIELLHYQRNQALSWLQIQEVINQLLRLGSREITLDKIKVSLENAPMNSPVVAPQGQIEQMAQQQLEELAQLFHLN